MLPRWPPVGINIAPALQEMEGEDLKWEWGEKRRAPVDVGDSGSKGKPFGLDSICSWLNSALAGTATNFAFDFQHCWEELHGTLLHLHHCSYIYMHISNNEIEY